MNNSAQGSSVTPAVSLDPVSSGIVSAVLYFDIFSYPLTAEEIKFNCHDRIAPPEVIEKKIHELLDNGMLFEKDGFYLLNDNDEAIIERRKKGNELSNFFFRKAKKYAAFISSFPFVRCVC